MRNRIKELIAEGKLSLRALEKLAFGLVVVLVLRWLVKLLEVTDDILMERRDKKRYVNQGLESREVAVQVGTVSFRRRRYWDRERGCNVYLLDEALGLRKNQRVGDGLAELAVVEAARGPSYREAKRRLEEIGGGALSHEGIRQLVMKMGDRLEENRMRENPKAGSNRLADVAFVVADGLWAALQREEKRRVEVGVVVAHRGWEVRQGRGETADYALLKPLYISAVGPGPGLWSLTRRCLAAEHGDIDRTTVVLGGDDAHWIRQGREYFGRVIYQRDRFHVARDISEALAQLPERGEAALRALRANDVDRLMGELTRGWEQTPAGPAQKRLGLLIRSLERDRESLVDYRERFRLAGRPVSPQWRGLGAAESNIKLYKHRLAVKGRAWSTRGLRAMLACLDSLNDGTLVDRVRGLSGELGVRGTEEPNQLSAGQVPLAVGRGSLGARQGHFPALDGALKGLAPLLRDLGRPQGI